MASVAHANMMCPRCARVITKGAEIDRFGTDKDNCPTYAHIGCKAATTAERLVLAGGAAVTGGWKSPEVVHRGTAVAPTRFTGQVFKEGTPRKDEEKTSSAARAIGDGPEQISVPVTDPAGEMTAENALSPEQFAELKEHTATRAQGFAAEVVAARIEQLADEKATTLVTVAVDQVERKLSNAGARAVAKAVTEQTKSLADHYQPIVAAACDEIRSKAAEADAAFRAAVERLDTMRRSVLVIESDAGTVEMPEGELYHVAFPEVLKLAAARFNVFMVGPTGSGKSHIGAQVAQALGLPFGLINGTAGTTEIELFGRGYPNITTGQNTYHSSEFVTVYEGGGVFVADEIDAMDANLLLKLNGAIAQGYCTVPHRPDKPRAIRHPNFVFIATANTWGGGATRTYCGRNQLDEATLDRLKCGSVDVDYDPALEIAFACPDPDLYEVLTRWRAAIMRNRLKRVLSTRFVAGAYKLKRLGYTVQEIGAKLSGGWPDAEREAVLGEDA